MITGEDVHNFTVKDAEKPCDKCRQHPGVIRIKALDYCLWCAFELARRCIPRITA